MSAAQVIDILSSPVETFTAKKKKAEGQAQKKQACQQLILSLAEAVTEGVKLQDRLKI